jgi:hypothetical protein
MPELNAGLARLTDEQILEIFRNYTVAPGNIEGRSVFLQLFADAVQAAPRRDFLLLRPFSLILIGKYNLGEYLDIDERRRA